MGAYEKVRKERKKGLESLFESRERNAWMKGMSEDDVEGVKRRFDQWVKEGPQALESGFPGKGKEVVMGGS